LASRRAALNDRYRVRQVGIADSVAGLLDRMLVSLDELDEVALERYVTRAYPTVAGGQLAAADNAAGYVSALVRRSARARAAPLDVGVALIRSGVAVTPESRSLVAPILRARSLVAGGQALPVALNAAASYAGALSSLDLQAAQRVGLAEGARAAEVEIGGWLKETGPTACEWCIMVSGETYGAAESVPFHENDKCAVVPELEAGATADVFGDEDIPF
jgi:hypothetical protein